MEGRGLQEEGCRSSAERQGARSQPAAGPATASGSPLPTPQTHTLWPKHTPSAPLPQPRRYSRKLPDALRARLLRRSLWDGLRARLLPELRVVCSQAVAASEAELPGKDAAMEALALGGPLGEPAMCGRPARSTLRGPSEAALLHAACPGCGVARYCSAACLRADAARHAPACAALRGMLGAHSTHDKPAPLAAEDSAEAAAEQLAGLRLRS